MSADQADQAPHPAEVAGHEEPNGRPQQVAMAPIMGPPDGYTQATRVQMAAAIAEVQAMVVTAKAHRRNQVAAQQEMRRSCEQPFMADQAFYEFPRGNQRVTGITVQLARELLRCWGNAQSGIIELQRHAPSATEPGSSEMQSWAWDMETNTRMSTTFLVRHVRDRSERKGGQADLDSDRDIYENNANLASRRERAMIERILPAWFVEMAKALCYKTLAGDPDTLPARRKDAVAKFAAVGVTQQMLEARVGLPFATWGTVDLAGLTVAYRSIQRGETTREEAFPDGGGAGTSAAATLAQAERDAAQGTPGGQQAQGGQGVGADPEDVRRANALRSIQAAFRQAGYGGKAKADMEARRLVVSMLLRHADTDPLGLVANATALDAEQAERVAGRLDAILADAAKQDPHERLAALAGAAEAIIAAAQAPPAGGEPQ